MDLIDREQLKATIRKMVEIPNETRAQVIGAISRAKAVEFVTENNVGDKFTPTEPLIDVHGKLMGLLQRAPYIGCADTDRQYAVNWLMNNGATIQPLPNCQKWIPVTERLPGESGEYLAYCGEYDGICVIHYEVLKTKGKWRTNWKAVTHWMPLPQAPKGE